MRAGSAPTRRCGPATSISDPNLLELIRQVLVASPFAGEGYRKVRGRLRREHGVQISGKRVLRLLRQEGLLAPQRVRGRRKPRPHDGTTRRRLDVSSFAAQDACAAEQPSPAKCSPCRRARQKPPRRIDPVEGWRWRPLGVHRLHRERVRRQAEVEPRLLIDYFR